MRRSQLEELSGRCLLLPAKPRLFMTGHGDQCGWWHSGPSLTRIPVAYCAGRRWRLGSFDTIGKKTSGTLRCAHALPIFPRNDALLHLAVDLLLGVFFVYWAGWTSAK